MNILFDGNYLYHKSYSVFSTYFRGQDMCDVLSDPENQQKLIRKCVIDMCATINKFKGVEEVAFVFDSRSWRYRFYLDYKYALTRVRDDSYSYFLTVLDKLEALLRKRGLIVSRVDGAEGDDLIYFWSLYYEAMEKELVIITGDSDIRQVINKGVALYNNNSKRLSLHCYPNTSEKWKNRIDEDVEIIEVIPDEVAVYKVVMGDTSDNIPKLKRGFGEKAWEKFIKEYQHFKDSDRSIHKMAIHIRDEFCRITGTDDRDDEKLNIVLFNLKMTYLDWSVYSVIGGDYNNGDALWEVILKDIEVQKGTFSYNKEYTLERFYGAIIV